MVLNVANYLYSVPSGFLGNGISLCIKDWSLALAERGHRIEILSWFENSNEPHFHEGVALRKLPNIRLYPGRFTLLNDIKRSLLLSKSLELLHRQHKIDVVDLHWPMMYLFVANKARRLGIRTVHTVHLSSLPDTLNTTPIKKRTNAYFNLRAARSVDGLVTVSQYLKSQYVEHGIPPEKIATIYPIINITGEDRCEKTERVRFLWVGRFDLLKRVDLAVRAALHLAKDNEKYEFTFVGHGPRYDLIEQAVSNRKLGNVRLLGQINDGRLLAQLRQECDIYFSTSVHETFGRTLAEAMAAGMACVATDIPVSKEVGGDNCLYFRPDDFEDLCKQLVALAKEPDWRLLLSRMAKSRAQKMFSAKTIGELHEQVYRKTLTLRG